MSIKKASNKQQTGSESKTSEPKKENEKSYVFPSLNKTIKASSPEEARKKLEKELRGEEEK